MNGSCSLWALHCSHSVCLNDTYFWRVYKLYYSRKNLKYLLLPNPQHQEPFQNQFTCSDCVGIFFQSPSFVGWFPEKNIYGKKSWTKVALMKNTQSVHKWTNQKKKFLIYISVINCVAFPCYSTLQLGKSFYVSGVFFWHMLYIINWRGRFRGKHVVIVQMYKHKEIHRR